MPTSKCGKSSTHDVHMRPYVAFALLMFRAVLSLSLFTVGL
jgi:hypothetical protein